jgi:hypothetical protein
MPTTTTDDMDVLELQDEEDALVDDAHAPIPEEEVREELENEEELAKEIDKVTVEEDAPAKAKPHMISDDLIIDL